MAEQKFPVTVKKGDVERLAFSPSQLVQFQFDGYVVKQDAPKQAKASAEAKADNGK